MYGRLRLTRSTNQSAAGQVMFQVNWSLEKENSSLAYFLFFKVNWSFFQNYYYYYFSEYMVKNESVASQVLLQVNWSLVIALKKEN